MAYLLLRMIKNDVALEWETITKKRKLCRRPSSFQLLLADVPQNYFIVPDDTVGVILKDDPKRVVAWRKSNNPELTSMIHGRTLKEMRLHEEFSRQMITDCTVADAATSMLALSHDWRQDEDNVEDLKIPFTEALIHYTIEDVAAVVLNPENSESCRRAIKFAKHFQVANIELPFVTKDEHGMGIVRTNLTINKLESLIREREEEAPVARNRIRVSRSFASHCVKRYAKLTAKKAAEELVYLEVVNGRLEVVEIAK